LFLILLNICALAKKDPKRPKKLPKKDKIGDQKNLLINLIFLKFVVCIRDAFGANYFIPQINIMSAVYSIRKKIFWIILVEL